MGTAGAQGQQELLGSAGGAYSSKFQRSTRRLSIQRTISSPFPLEAPSTYPWAPSTPWVQLPSTAT